MTKKQIIKAITEILAATEQNERTGKYQAFEIAAYMRDVGKQKLEAIKKAVQEMT